jgi:uncharacterized cupredoxin-like copper-binding protein
MQHRRTVLGAAVVAIAVPTAALLGVSTAGAGDGPSAAAAARTRTYHVNAASNNRLRFTRTRLTVRAGRVKIQMRNPSGNNIPHAIAVEGHGVDKDGRVVQAGGTSSVTVRLRPGRYTFYCPVDGHEDAGMKGTLVVR